MNMPVSVAAGQPKNRRALGDIGNLVTLKPLDGKPLPAVTRPVTRSFCAQLLANAQAAEKKKKPVAVNVVKKKAVAKPKPPPVPEFFILSILSSRFVDLWNVVGDF